MYDSYFVFFISLRQHSSSRVQSPPSILVNEHHNVLRRPRLYKTHPSHTFKSTEGRWSKPVQIS